MPYLALRFGRAGDPGGFHRSPWRRGGPPGSAIPPPEIVVAHRGPPETGGDLRMIPVGGRQDRGLGGKAAGAAGGGMSGYSGSSPASGAHQADHDALDDQFGGRDEVRVAGIFGPEKGAPILFDVTFERGFSVDQGGDDILVARLS